MKNIFITGRPGVGKTTLMRNLAQSLPPSSFLGFVTDEIRERGRRLGFAIQPFDGPKFIMAHVNFQTHFRVGKYGVKPEVVEQVVEQLSRLSKERTPAIYLIDEIGKMESYASRFRQWMEEILSSPAPVIATIARRGDAWIESLKRRPDVQMLEITLQNRNDLLKNLLEIAMSLIKPKESC